MVFGAQAANVWTAVAILSLATAGHQIWAANMFASISDMFPKNAVSSVTGLSGFGGSVGGMLVATAVGLVLEWTGSYVPAFTWAGIAYLVILGIIHVMIPVIGPVKMEERA
jgi:ACS family hexuronate transporter-like MFS transporter